MNYMMIFMSIFLFGVGAGLVLAHLIATRNDDENKRLRDWKNQF